MQPCIYNRAIVIEEREKRKNEGLKIWKVAFFFFFFYYSSTDIFLENNWFDQILFRQMFARGRSKLEVRKSIVILNFAILTCSTNDNNVTRPLFTVWVRFRRGSKITITIIVIWNIYRINFWCWQNFHCHQQRLISLFADIFKAIFLIFWYF